MKLSLEKFITAATDRLRRELPELKLTLDKPYRELTTLGVGGALPVLAEPADKEQLARLLKLLRRNEIPFFILGGGSNLVGMDDPYPGVGVRLDRRAFGTFERDGELIHAGARSSLPELAAFSAREGLRGLAALSCIPGSLGGAIRMNASCRGTAIGELIEEVEGVKLDGKPWRAEGKRLKWRYRQGGVPDDVVITGATLRLAPGDAEEEAAALEAERAKRRASEPSGRSAGCVFRNVSPEEPAGMLIDKCGLRGAKVGGAEVSEKHANYIVNASGEASERDFLTLARLVRRTVKERFGRELRPEVRFVRDCSARQLVEDTAPVPKESRLTRTLLLVCLYMYQILALLAGMTMLVIALRIKQEYGAGAGNLELAFAVLLLAGFVINLCRKW